MVDLDHHLDSRFLQFFSYIRLLFISSVFSDKLEVHTPNKSTQRHHRIIYNELDKLLQFNALNSSRKTESSDVLHQISELLHKRSLVMIFSDFVRPYHFQHINFYVWP